MNQLPMKIKNMITIENHSYAHYCYYYYYFFFFLPHQTSFLLYKCRFDEVNFTRRCFHDGKFTKISPKYR